MSTYWTRETFEAYVARVDARCQTELGLASFDAWVAYPEAHGRIVEGEWEAQMRAFGIADDMGAQLEAAEVVLEGGPEAGA